MNINEAMKFLGVSEKTLRRWIASGKVPARKIHGPNGPQLDLDPQVLEEVKAKEQHCPEVVAKEEALVRPGQDALPLVQSDPSGLLPQVPPRALDLLEDIAGALISTLVRSGQGSHDRSHSGHDPGHLGEPVALLTVEQVAQVLQVSPTKVRELLREGKLRGIQGMGRGWRIKREDLKKFVEEL